MSLFNRTQLASGRDAMPFGKTPATARCCRVLGDKHRVSAERRLLTIVRGFGRRQTTRDEIARVIEHGRHSFRLQVLSLFDTESE